MPPRVILRPADLNLVDDFVERVAEDTYRRMSGSAADSQLHRDRIRCGKRGELAFLRYLQSLDLHPPGIPESMFAVYPGTRNVDAFDFLLPDSRAVDVKSVPEQYAWLLVPTDQFSNTKAFYVLVEVSEQPCVSGAVLGYAVPGAFVWPPRYVCPEHPAKGVHRRNLSPISRLLPYFRP